MSFDFDILERALSTDPADVAASDEVTREVDLARSAAIATRLMPVFADFVASGRPHNHHQRSAGVEPLLVRLRVHPGDRATLVRFTCTLLCHTKHISLYADAGILPSTGFVGELYRRVSHRVLPEVVNPIYLRDCLAEAFSDPRDDDWLAAVSDEQWQELIHLLQPDGDALAARCIDRLDTELSNAINVLSLRLAGLGLEAELLRVYPDLEEHDSPFVAQQHEVQCWRAGRALPADPVNADITHDRGQLDHALVLLDQCRSVLERVRKKTALIGTSFQLTYLIRRLLQTIQRLELLANVTGASTAAKLVASAQLLREVSLAQAQRNDIGKHIAQSMDLVALRVTENAGRTGEHYITETRAEYFVMFRAALGAGFVVAFMAWAKVFIVAMKLPALIEIFCICAMYALSFIVIHLLHFSLATKQPAMTAAAIAAALEDNRQQTNASRIERMIDMVARVTRSQLAAIVGNIALTIPTAILLTYFVFALSGAHIVETVKAQNLMHDASLLSLAPIYAGIAGVLLFFGGLISGYFDNKSSYSRIRERLQAHIGLNALLGRARNDRFARYIEDNLGALAGNAALGIMLGVVGPLGTALGLPLDVRHVTITAAGVGLALPAISFDVAIGTAFAMLFGVAAIGLFNLTVSFSLTLMLAFKARNVSLPERSSFFPALWRRARSNPREFLLPPKADHTIKP